MNSYGGPKEVPGDSPSQTRGCQVVRIAAFMLRTSFLRLANTQRVHEVIKQACGNSFSSVKASV
jgi:hypothetical protein